MLVVWILLHGMEQSNLSLLIFGQSILTVISVFILVLDKVIDFLHVVILSLILLLELLFIKDPQRCLGI